MYAPVSKFGLPCAFFGRSDFYRFKLEKYMQSKEKDVYNFFLQY